MLGSNVLWLAGVLGDKAADKLVPEQRAVVVEHFGGYFGSPQGTLERCAEGQQSQIGVDVGVKRLVAGGGAGRIHQQYLWNRPRAALTCTAGRTHADGISSGWSTWPAGLTLPRTAEVIF